MNQENDFPIYCVKEVIAILKISSSSLFRIRKEAGLKTPSNKRKTRYTLSEIKLLAEYIKQKNSFEL
jgi:hypothetical protein